MKFTIGQRVRFYVSREFLEGQELSADCSPGWVTGKVAKLLPQYYDRPVKVSLDSETNILSAYVNSLCFSEEGTYYLNTDIIEEAEQLTLQPLTILKRRHL